MGISYTISEHLNHSTDIIFRQWNIPTTQQVQRCCISWSCICKNDYNSTLILFQTSKCTFLFSIWIMYFLTVGINVDHCISFLITPFPFFIKVKVSSNAVIIIIKAMQNGLTHCRFLAGSYLILLILITRTINVKF